MTLVGRLPATAAAVYLGAIGNDVLSGNFGGFWDSAVLALGVGITLITFVYLLRLARRTLRNLDPTITPHMEATLSTTRRRFITPLVVAIAAAMATAAFFADDLSAALVAAQSNKVQMKEAYEAKPDGPVFDHSGWNALLQQHVTPDRGLVNYEAIRKDPAALNAYLESLAAADFEAMGRDEKLAFLINAYNAFTIRLILDHWPVGSIYEIPPEKRWDSKQWNLAGRKVSLNEIEHEMIRPNFIEPNIHWAVVCAAVGCPPLRNEAFTGEKLSEQLAAQARYVHNNEPWFSFDADAGEGGTVTLTQLYQWYGHDFEQVTDKGGILAFAARYNEKLEKALKAGKKPAVKWAEYDWSLNDRPE